MIASNGEDACLSFRFLYLRSIEYSSLSNTVGHTD